VHKKAQQRQVQQDQCEAQVRQDMRRMSLKLETRLKHASRLPSDQHLSINIRAVAIEVFLLVCDSTALMTHQVVVPLLGGRSM